MSESRNDTLDLFRELAGTVAPPHGTLTPPKAQRRNPQDRAASSVTEERIAGNKRLIFRYQSEIKGKLRPFEIKFELGTFKWFLWKM